MRNTKRLAEGLRLPSVIEKNRCKFYIAGVVVVSTNVRYFASVPSRFRYHRGGKVGVDVSLALILSQYLGRQRGQFLER